MEVIQKQHDQQSETDPTSHGGCDAKATQPTC